ncbi:DUF3850 domain-containing protein [Bradyrhizobium sp. SZCCHNPS10062]|uniref:DUF3850 domain-containing protein n=1 Tax=unclassified Bradyrhizobium TaxID=2631580 RepID=UPI0039647394
MSQQPTCAPIPKPSEATDKADHELKCWPQFFDEIQAGRKKHDLRRSNDRKFKVGDVLLLREFDPKKDGYTGRSTKVRVTYVTSSDLPCALSREALHPNFCILSIQPV